MKPRMILLAVCGFVAYGFSPAPVRAQASNCSDILLTVKTNTVKSNGQNITYEDYTFNVNCRNTNTGVIYANSLNFTSATGAASFGPCNPTWQYAYVIPSTVTSGTQNTVTITATSRDWVSVQGKCQDGIADAQTSYCTAIACPSCPPGYLWNKSTNSCVKVSPIVVDISGKGFFLTDAQNGVLFDPGTGRRVQMAWTAKGADNAFLALPGADGLVHDGKQLFGNFTPQPPSATPNGFAALAVFDDPKNGGNGDGIIDARDAIFSSLRLWIDANHDGTCQPGELHTLPSLGVNSFSLKYKEADKTDQYGNIFRYRAKVNPDDPDTSQVNRTAYDVFFVTETSTAKHILSRNPANNAKCPAPTLRPSGGMPPIGK